MDDSDAEFKTDSSFIEEVDSRDPVVVKNSLTPKFNEI